MNAILKKPLFRASLSLLLSAFLFSCQEEETITTESGANTDQLIMDEAIADDLFEDMDEISMEAAAYTTNSRISNEGAITQLECVTRTVERNGDLRSLVTLTFTGECEGPRGRTRSGTLLVERSIDLNAATYTVSTTFQDFFVNGHQLEGTRTLVYTYEDKQQISVNITLTDGRVTLADGSVITRNGNFTRTIDRAGGRVTVTGSATGTNRNGVDYVSEITTPLVFQRSCAADGIYMPAQGVKSITRSGRADLEINFGEGNCDKSVTLTAEGENRIVEINFTRK